MVSFLIKRKKKEKKKYSVKFIILSTFSKPPFLLQKHSLAFQDVPGSFLVLSGTRGRAGLTVLLLVFMFRHLVTIR